MGNYLYAQVSIKGSRALLFNKFGPESLPLEKGERAGVAGNDPTEWRRSYTATADGRLFLDPSYVFGAIRDGSRNIKKGRGSIMPLVASTLQVLDDRVVLDRTLPADLDSITRDSEQLIYVDVRGVKNPASKARNIRYRLALAPGWEATFTLMWDKTVVSRGEMQAALIHAGRLAGLADGRSIGFGRFEVECFEVTDDAPETPTA